MNAYYITEQYAQVCISSFVIVILSLFGFFLDH